MLFAMLNAAAPRRRGLALAVVAAVVTLHAALGLWLLGARAWPELRLLAAPPPMVVRLLVAEPGRSPVPPPLLPAPPTGRRAARAPLPPRPDSLRAIVVPAPPAGPLAGALPAESAPASAASAASAPQAPPLRLALPHGASAPERRRNPALDDPRANTPRRTLEAAIAGTMGGDDRLVEEMLGDGRIRYRRGSDCILVQPSRGAQVDPFNQSALNTPRLVGPC